MSAPLKAAWALTAFVVLVGIVGAIVTGEVFFVVFIVLGLLTAVGAWVSGRSTGPKENNPS